MSDHYIDSRGMNRADHIMFEYEFSATEFDGRRFDKLTHTNYSESLGEGLFRPHQWIQHKHGYRKEDYTITRVRRRLRGISPEGVRYPTDNYIELIDWPKGTPATPDPHPPKPKAQEPSMEFMAEVPVAEKPSKKGKK